MKVNAPRIIYQDDQDWCECVVAKKGIMRIDLQNLQPVELLTDSTEPTESRELSEHLQAAVDRCTKSIAGLILDDPCISAPEILRQLTEGGQHGSERRVVHMFGGPWVFRQTCYRMEMLRWVLATHQWERMPFQMDIQYREWEGRRRYHRKPGPNGDWVSWWAPDMFSAAPFEPMEDEEEEGGLGGQRRLYRFPAREDESDYFANERKESEPYDSDVSMTEVEGHRE